MRKRELENELNRLERRYARLFGKITDIEKIIKKADEKSEMYLYTVEKIKRVLVMD